CASGTQFCEAIARNIVCCVSGLKQPCSTSSVSQSQPTVASASALTMLGIDIQIPTAGLPASSSFSAVFSRSNGSSSGRQSSTDPDGCPFGSGGQLPGQPLADAIEL